MEATFDTLAYFKKLKAVGVPEDQANVQAQALRELADGTLATKKDIKNIEYNIKELEYRTSIELKSLENRLLVKMAVIGAFYTGAIIAVIQNLK